VVVVVGNYEFAAGLTRKAAPSACTKPSHYPRRSQNTPGEVGDSHEVYGAVASNRNRVRCTSEPSFIERGQPSHGRNRGTPGRCRFADEPHRFTGAARCTVVQVQ